MEPYNGKRAHLKCNSLSTSFSQAVLSFFFSPNALFTVLSKLYIPSTTINIDFFTLEATIDCRCLAYFDPKKYTLMSFSSHFRFLMVLADEVSKIFIYIF